MERITLSDTTYHLTKKAYQLYRRFDTIEQENRLSSKRVAKTNGIDSVRFLQTANAFSTAKDMLLMEYGIATGQIKKGAK